MADMNDQDLDDPAAGAAREALKVAELRAGLDEILEYERVRDRFRREPVCAPPSPPSSPGPPAAPSRGAKRWRHP